MGIASPISRPIRPLRWPRNPPPLSIIQILAVDLSAGMIPALALGAGNPDPDTMRRPP
ncbi:MAG TPA: cation transporting ATPase C-terminal domain-containing protein [Nitrospiria bacterium]|nr:cation transporting ATPase C-terminal domain-containing protein [Nitrospiria bacterium]